MCDNNNSIDSLTKRFAKVISEMDTEILELKRKNALLESQLRISSFTLQQATDCGKCGEYKHTPWKDDEFGFICASCLVAIKDEEILKLKMRIGETV